MDPAYEYHNTIFYPSLKSTALQSIQCTHIHSTFTAQSNGNECKMYNCINSMRDRSYILCIPKLSFIWRQKIQNPFVNIARGTTDPGFGLQMALLVLLVNVANSWCFLHHQASIGYTSCHQMAPLSLFLKLANRSHHLHSHIAFDCPISIVSWF